MTLFTGCQSLRGYRSRLLLWPLTVSEVLVLSTSSKSSAQSRTCHVGHSVQLNAATCSFRGQTRPSASEVSPSRLQSGTHFHQTSAHRTTVANSSDLSWKPIFSDKLTLHDSSENIVEECNSVTVTVRIGRQNSSTEDWPNLYCWFSKEIFVTTHHTLDAFLREWHCLWVLSPRKKNDFFAGCFQR